MSAKRASCATSASATDDTDPSPTITYSHASGSTFPIATTTVTVTAKDWKGNSSTCTFNVTVAEPENSFAGTYVGSWMYWDLDGDYVGWYEWTFTVSEDGTVAGTGVQTSLWVWPPYYLPDYVAPMPDGYSGTGSISAYGLADVAWSYSEGAGGRGNTTTSVIPSASRGGPRTRRRTPPRSTAPAISSSATTTARS